MVHVHDRNIQNIALLGAYCDQCRPNITVVALLDSTGFYCTVPWLYLTLLHFTMVLHVLDSFIKRHITVTVDKGFFSMDSKDLYS